MLRLSLALVLVLFAWQARADCAAIGSTVMCDSADEAQAAATPQENWIDRMGQQSVIDAQRQYRRDFDETQGGLDALQEQSDADGDR